MINKILIALALVLISFSGYCQKNVAGLFDEYGKEDNITKVKLDENTISMAKPYLGDMKIESVEVLEMSKCNDELKSKVTESIKKFKDENYETIVSANENGHSTKVLILIDKDVIRELVVLHSETPALVWVKGEIKQSDIQKITASL